MSSEKVPNQISSSSSSSHILLSTSILFRHGARGPGKSEVAPWDKTNHVVSQWEENEFEQLSSLGLQQMNSLGAFFTHRCEKLHLKAPSFDNYRFYSSKEKRAKHSGDEFVASFLKTFNKQDTNNQVKNDSNIMEIGKNIPDTPLPMDPDFYFRPWKIYTDVDRVVKSKRDSVATINMDPCMTSCLAQSSSMLSLSSLSQQNLQTTPSELADIAPSTAGLDKQWHDKVLEYEELLRRIGETLQMKQSIAIHPHLVLWSTTHIQCLLTCERDWPSQVSTDETSQQCIHDSNTSRKALRQLMPLELERPVMELACWVWQQRFTQSGYQVDLGGWMFLLLVQQTFDLSQSSNIVMCAGHDYTVLCMLSAAGVLSTLATPLKFGCYVIFELWGDQSIQNESATNMTTAAASANENLSEENKKVCQQTSESDSNHNTNTNHGNINNSSNDNNNKRNLNNNNNNNMNNNDSSAVFKILCNSHPFDYACNNNSSNANDNSDATASSSSTNTLLPTPLPSVHAEREVVMAQLSMTELRTRVESVCATLIAHGRGLPPGFSMPLFLIQHTATTNACDEYSDIYSNSDNSIHIHDDDDDNVKHIDSDEIKSDIHTSEGSGTERGRGTGGRTEVETETEVTSVSVGDTYSKCTSFASNKSSNNNNSNNTNNKSSSGVDIAQILARMDSDKSSAAIAGGGALAADAVPLTSHDQLQSQPQPIKATSRRRQQTVVTDCCC